jgi:hypothetical protein
MKIILTLTAVLFFANTYAQDMNLATGIFEGEPYLAINPTNPQNIVVAWMHITTTNRPIRVRSSFDGGNTWNAPYDLPHIWSNTADPNMAFDNSGNLFLCFIDHKGTSSDTGSVYSYKSSDGGITWGSPAEVINIFADSSHNPIDRPWLVCDRSNGPFQGTLYVTTMPVHGTPAPYHPYFIKSIDSGQTWQSWRYADTTGWLSGLTSPMAAPVVSSDGIFHCIYPSYVATQNPFPRYLMASSSNGGASFNYSPVINSLNTVSNDSAKLAWQMISNPVNPNHLVFFNVKFNYGDADIFMTETYNGGTSWSSPVRVNDDVQGNGKMQDMVWASFDNDSDLVVCWRDRRNGTGIGYANSSEIFGAVRWKDSTNFSANFTISDTLVPYNNILVQAGNDFLSQQVFNDTLYIAWGDTRTGFLNIWFDKIALANNTQVGLINIAHEELPIIEIYPNPATEIVHLKTENQIMKNLKLFNMQGELIQEYVTNDFSVSNLPDGIYFIRVETDKSIFTNKLIKQ